MPSILLLAACPLPISLSLTPPISLPQHGRSEFSWEGINVSVVTPLPFPPPPQLGPFHFHPNPKFTFTSGWQLYPSSRPLNPPRFTVSLCVGSRTLVLHVCEHNKQAPLTGAHLKHSNLSKLKILFFYLLY